MQGRGTDIINKSKHNLKYKYSNKRVYINILSFRHPMNRYIFLCVEKQIFLARNPYFGNLNTYKTKTYFNIIRINLKTKEILETKT